MNTLHKKMVLGLTAITAVMFVSCKKADETPVVPPVVPPVVIEASKIQVTGLTATKSTVSTKDSIEFVVTVTNNGGADSAGTTISSTIGATDGGFFTTGKMAAKAVLPKTVKIAPLVAGTHVVTYFTGAGTAKTMKSVTVVVEVPLVTVVGSTVVTKEVEKEIVTDVLPKVTGVTANTTLSDLAKTAATIVNDPVNAKIDDNAKATLNAVAEIGKVGLTIDPAAKLEGVSFSDTNVAALFVPLTPKARQVSEFYFVMLELPFSQVKSTTVKADGSVAKVFETKPVTVSFVASIDNKEIIAFNNLGGVTIDIATGAVTVEKGSDVLWTTLANSKEIASVVKGKVVNVALLKDIVGAFAANFGAYGNLGSIANTLPMISVAPVAKKFAEQVGADARYTTWNDFVAKATGNKPVFTNSKTATETKAYTNPATTETQTYVFTATDADGDVATYSVETAFTRWTVVGTQVHAQGSVN